MRDGGMSRMDDSVVYFPTGRAAAIALCAQRLNNGALPDRAMEPNIRERGPLIGCKEADRERLIVGFYEALTL